MSELLNIWREVGSYNRFAETKNTILLGVLITLLGLITKEPSQHFLYTVLFGGHIIVFLTSLLIAAGICLLALFPILSFPSGLLGEPRNPPPQMYNPYFFYHIAQRISGDEWLQTLLPALPDEEKARARQLAQQIWIISRIARRKFFLFRISALVLVGGWLVSWVFVLARMK
jgi:hypothetical protein